MQAVGASRGLLAAQAAGGGALPGLVSFGTNANATGGSGVRCGQHAGDINFNLTWEALNCVDTYKVDSQIFIT
jgi:hypothetical protein